MIFHQLVNNWRKVARVAGYAKEACNARSLPSAEAIEGVGNLSMWRHSEVRLITC
jgi:hypothetical protein